MTGSLEAADFQEHECLCGGQSVCSLGVVSVADRAGWRGGRRISGGKDLRCP